MSVAFFNSAERVQTLCNVLESWRGTPFMDHVARKGVGADCVRFVLSVLQECGQMPAIDWPRYTIRHGGVPMMKFWEEWVLKNKCGFEVSTPAAGDVVFFSGIPAGSNHVGIFSAPPLFYHSLIKYGVVESTLDDATYLKSIHKIWRPSVI